MKGGTFQTVSPQLMANMWGLYSLNIHDPSFTIMKGFTVLLLVFVDYDYRCLIAEVGCQGRISDGGVYRNSNFYSALKTQQLNLPEPRLLPQSSDPFWESTQCKVDPPIVFVADDAFPLSTNCMKPFGFKNASDMERIFDYRLSRFRRIAENGFGIWNNRFKLFSTKTQLTPEKTAIAVMASLALQNMLRTKSSESYTPVGFIDTETNDGIIEGTWREGTAPNLALGRHTIWKNVFSR